MTSLHPPFIASLRAAALALVLMATAAPAAADDVPSFFSAHATGLAAHGIRSPEALRDALTGPSAFRGRRAALLRESIGDLPGAAAAWRRIIEEDPTDLEALHQATFYLHLMGNWIEALSLLEVAERDQPAFGPVEGGRIVPVDLHGLRCQILHENGRQDEAAEACTKALEGPAGAATIHRAIRFAFKRQDWEQGEILAERLTRREEAGATDWFLLGLARLGVGKEKAARLAFEESRRRSPAYPPAWYATESGEPLLFEVLSMHEREAALDALADGTAGCAPLYFELGLVEQAERCLTAADRIQSGRSGAARIAWLARDDREAARATASFLLGQSRHTDVLLAAAKLDVEDGRHTEARRLLEEAVMTAPVNDEVNRLLAQLCRRDGDGECVSRHEGRLVGPPQRLDKARALLFGAIGLLVLAAGIALIRQKVRRG